jgi:ATP-dependent Lon protease
VLAARRSGVRELVLPRDNEPNLEDEVPPELRGLVAIRFASTIEQVVELVLGERLTDEPALEPQHIAQFH